MLNSRRGLAQEVFRQLVEIQATFLSLLADPKSKQLTRESCCIGLAALHGFSIACSGESIFNVSRQITNYHETKVLNERLLRAFGESKHHGGSAFMETRNQHAQRIRSNDREEHDAISMAENFGMETEIGGTAGMGEAALGAYREMANAVVTLDRPDILYTLMLLSVSLPIWSTRSSLQHFSSSSILGMEDGMTKKTDELKEVLYPHLKTLIPRLLRACKDPNKQTREQMEALWIGLTGESSKYLHNIRTRCYVYLSSSPL